MKKLAFVALLVVSLLLGCFILSTQTIESASKPETRCGWFGNPTPANAWLVDRTGEWIIGLQGSYLAEGDWPDFKPEQWVETNGHYGYGCACLKVVTTTKPEKRIIKILSSNPRPLSACRQDKALKNKER